MSRDRIGLRSPALLPTDNLIEPRWSPEAANQRPRSPHRRIVLVMRPLIPRAGLGAARSRTEPGRGRNRLRQALSTGAKFQTFFD
jgi:hypothetical protein